ncbi:uncharacterized protein PV06_01878 [Exophiala oligosperma]|uniref:Uncharacterized protein n=1 Tax=Exophiala oligosperma TaxID=215243 RepID=A0A0D2DSZ2_9EURO|nr:uncharacterized protein PV06_01878 [Exophiala oligosperma]KIW46193.1 hypothetical protein PV06_01878 [Exophiala oligosperma]
MTAGNETICSVAYLIRLMGNGTCFKMFATFAIKHNALLSITLTSTLVQGFSFVATSSRSLVVSAWTKSASPPNFQVGYSSLQWIAGLDRDLGLRDNGHTK